MHQELAMLRDRALHQLTEAEFTSLYNEEHQLQLEAVVDDGLNQHYTDNKPGKD